MKSIIPFRSSGSNILHQYATKIATAFSGLVVCAAQGTPECQSSTIYNIQCVHLPYMVWCSLFDLYVSCMSILYLRCKAYGMNDWLVSMYVFRYASISSICPAESIVGLAEFQISVSSRFASLLYSSSHQCLYVMLPVGRQWPL